MIVESSSIVAYAHTHTRSIECAHFSIRTSRNWNRLLPSCVMYCDTAARRMLNAQSVKPHTLRSRFCRFRTWMRRWPFAVCKHAKPEAYKLQLKTDSVVCVVVCFPVRFSISKINAFAFTTEYITMCDERHSLVPFYLFRFFVAAVAVHEMFCRESSEVGCAVRDSSCAHGCRCICGSTQNHHQHNQSARHNNKHFVDFAFWKFAVEKHVNAVWPVVNASVCMCDDW